MDRQISVGIRKKRFRRHRSEAIASIYWRSGVARAAATEMLSFVTLLLAASAVSASVIQGRPERKLADADFLNKQKLVLSLFVGIGHNNHIKDKYSSYDLNAKIQSFSDEKYPKEFLKAYKRGLLPQNGIFSLNSQQNRQDAIRLFDLFFFAKDFDTFIEVAGWARVHLNPGLFVYAYTLALIHRSDTQNFIIPPLYEVLPNLFTPAETLHQVYDAKMSGIKEGRFSYNTTGYEYNYHTNEFGGQLSPDNRGYGDFMMSYFNEDVGLNNFIGLFFLRNPSWLSSEKYNTPWHKRRGENFYQFLQQLFARYSQERTSNDLPNAEILQWTKPIKVGYNPRLTYLNGQSLYNRPDDLVPEHHNTRGVVKAQNIERRVWDLVDAQAYWETANQSLVHLDEHNGVEILGRIIYGTVDRPFKNYYQSLFYSGLEALAFITSTASDRSFVGNALSTSVTAARDPAFFNYVARLIKIFQHFKRAQRSYNHDDVAFNGVEVQNVEIDKFLTYFDRFDYEVTSSVPVEQKSDYKEHRYYARQYRLNHKPYNYNVTVKSSNAGDAIVRVFLGNKYDVDEHELTVNQARLTFVEIDRFIAKLNAGVNVFERNSKESPIFTSDDEGYRSLYNNINNALTQKTPFYINEYGRCGVPERLQLPLGWKGGRPAQLAVIVNSYDRNAAHPENNKYDIACGGAALYDGRPVGFPFDRPIHHDEFNVPNIFFKEVNIHHRELSEVNRPASV